MRIVNEDFLDKRQELFDFIIGNPPYVPITGLSEAERRSYRARFVTATGRFDLYLLFFEQALKLLKPGGRLVFITPEKFFYVQTAELLRKTLGKLQIDELHLLPESTFGALTTYPAVTTVVNTPASRGTRVILRDGIVSEVRLPTDGSSWLPSINGAAVEDSQYSLGDACVRISCGVATGADAVYLVRTSQLEAPLRRFAFPTVAGREIHDDRGITSSYSMLVPYARNGDLLREEQLGELGAYLSQPERQRKLLARTCARHKRWYAFHENPPMADILRPKILCKDIASHPSFFVESRGELMPRHSAYYLVPKDPSTIHQLCDYLNSAVARAWLTAHCQRAANGFLRLQSHVLRALPIPSDFLPTPQLDWREAQVAS